MQQSLGLTSQHAEELLKEFGRNEITTKPRQTAFQIFLSQFTSLLVMLLIFAAVASIFLKDFIDGFFILLIVLLNGILGFVQEHKAEKAIAALKKMTVSTVRVIRDNTEQKIDSALLVPGDLLILEEGDKISADCILVESIHMAANEAALTGESLPVEKNANDEIYLGTIVARGRGRAHVTTTGLKTRFGAIAESLSEIQKEETPLQKKLDTLGKQLGILAIFASTMTFGIGFYKQHPLIEMMLTSISLAVAAVPEGLPAVITITLAVGMQRMARKKAILRKLSSIESLGSVNIIATDKTGTLTKNEMRVVRMWLDNTIFSIRDTHLNQHATFQKLLTAGILCNNAHLHTSEKTGRTEVLGDTTEGALLYLAQDTSTNIDAIRKNGHLVEEFAFDPHIKRMSIVWQDPHGMHMYAKGAPESMLEKCDTIITAQGTQNLTDETRTAVKKTYEQLAQEGLRVLALAYRDLSTKPGSREEAENNLTLIGLVGIADPPREEVAQAISIAHEAGIRTIMITGDNELTAHAIGSHIGLIDQGAEMITGAQCAKLSDVEMTEKLKTVQIFARTSPDQKLRIVRLLQGAGNIVAVTGDGVNDALALKQADVGVAMGITGTDVAKEAADMIITNDNYASLVDAVEEGRTIFDNIKSAIKFLVGCNVGEIIAVLGGILLGWPLILTPLQLLYINLVTDGLPALALAVTPKNDGVMKRKPRFQKNLFETIDYAWLIETGILTAITTLVAFYIGEKLGGLMLGRAFAFSTIILVQQFILLDTWTKDGSFMQKKIFTDKIFLLAFLCPLILQPLLIYTPVLSNIFRITPLNVSQFIYVVALAAIVLLSSEVRKRILRS